MENNIASILFAAGIMPDDFISYSTYGAVGKMVKDYEQQINQLKAERQEMVDKLAELLKAFDDSDKNYADWVATKELYSAFTGVNNLLERLKK